MTAHLLYLYGQSIQAFFTHYLLNHLFMYDTVINYYSCLCFVDALNIYTLVVHKSSFGNAWCASAGVCVCVCV